MPFSVLSVSPWWGSASSVTQPNIVARDLQVKRRLGGFAGRGRLALADLDEVHRLLAHGVHPGQRRPLVGGHAVAGVGVDLHGPGRLEASGAGSSSFT